MSKKRESFTAITRRSKRNVHLMLGDERLESSHFALIDTGTCEVLYTLDGHPFTSVADPNVTGSIRRWACLKSQTTKRVLMTLILSCEPMSQFCTDNPYLIFRQVDMTRHLQYPNMRLGGRDFENEARMTGGETARRGCLHQSPCGTGHDNFSPRKGMSMRDGNQSGFRPR